MIAVIFEVWPKPERKKEYLDIAAQLRPILERIDGFISIERFESLNEPGKILSLSFFHTAMTTDTWATAGLVVPVPAQVVGAPCQYVPHEGEKVSLPPYTIEPPDILLIDAQR